MEQSTQRASPFVNSYLSGSTSPHTQHWGTLMGKMLRMQDSQTGTLETFVSWAPQRRQSEGKIVEKSEPINEAKRGRKVAATTLSARVLSPVLLKTDLQSAKLAEVSI
jgi:hypothetical protein